jgi:hypothetical protein
MPKVPSRKARGPRRPRPNEAPKSQPVNIRLPEDLWARAKEFQTQRDIESRREGQGRYSFRDLVVEALTELLARRRSRPDEGG